MASQEPPLLNPGVPGYTHFWAQNTTTYLKINELNHRIANVSLDAPDNRSTVELWAAICNLYFPNSTDIVGGPVWTVNSEVDANSADHTVPYAPDLVRVRLGTASPIPQKRDYLWVQCQKAALDRPSGWKNAIENVVSHLKSAHATSNVFLIVAIGTKCMLLAWNPRENIKQPQLSIQSSRAGPNKAPPTVWHMDSRVKFIQSADWVDPVTGRLDTSQAYKLDCTTMRTEPFPGGGEQQVLERGTQLGLIEAYLVAISHIVFGKDDPIHSA